MNFTNHHAQVNLRIAMIGTRGVPANYGGFETCIEEVGQRLVKRGHHVTVYCRNSYYEKKRKKYLGMDLVYLPNLEKKTLDTISHTFLSVWHALLKNYNVYMVFNAANSFFLFPLRLFGKRIIINTDGVEWERSKWGFWGRTYYKLSEKMACLVANRLVSDSKRIKDYYREVHHTKSTEIAYGAYVQDCNYPKRLKEIGLVSGEYFLQITRFEPENYPLLTLRAFKKLNSKKKLVLVGGNPYPNRYTHKIEQEADGNVFLPGFIYDEKLLKELRCNCFAYVHGNSVGGTSPALLESMASGCFSIAFDIVFNRDVLFDCGVYYRGTEDSLAEKMQWAIDNKDKLDVYRRKAQKRIGELYSWDKIADQYERLFFDLHRGKYLWRFNWRALFAQKGTWRF